MAGMKNFRRTGMLKVDFMDPLQQRPVGLGQHDAAAGGHDTVGPAAEFLQHRRLAGAESRLPFVREERAEAA